MVEPTEPFQSTTQEREIASNPQEIQENPIEETQDAEEEESDLAFDEDDIDEYDQAYAEGFIDGYREGVRNLTERLQDEALRDLFREMFQQIEFVEVCVSIPFDCELLLDRGRMFCLCFEVNHDDKQLYYFETESEIDPVMGVYWDRHGALGELAFKNDETEADLNPKILIELKSGTYAIIIAGNNHNQFGAVKVRGYLLF